jgi:hypothetical protein
MVIARDSFARDKILSVASQFVRENGASSLEVSEIAQLSEVDVETVEYFFDSKTQLVAEAQLSNYFEMVEPHHLVLNRVETAAANKDETGFWVAIEENMEMAWTSGQVGQKWGIIRLLMDIWSDPFAQSHFCELLDIQFERWITVVERAQSLGWVDTDIDARAMTAVFWSASIGQVITAGSSVLEVSPRATKDFLMRIVRGRSHQDLAF